MSHHSGDDGEICVLYGGHVTYRADTIVSAETETDPLGV